MNNRFFEMANSALDADTARRDTELARRQAAEREQEEALAHNQLRLDREVQPVFNEAVEGFNHAQVPAELLAPDLNIRGPQAGIAIGQKGQFRATLRVKPTSTGYRLYIDANGAEDQRRVTGQDIASVLNEQLSAMVRGWYASR